MTAKGAYISVDQLVNSILLQRGKTIHSYVKFLKLVADAVRELSLSDMPLIQHTIITKERHKTWFALPRGYTDWVSVGYRVGDHWRPVAVSNRLLPFPNNKRDPEYNEQFNKEYNHGGWTSWLNPQYKQSFGDFAGEDFFNQDYLVEDNVNTPKGNINCGCGDMGWAYPYAYGGNWFWSDYVDQYNEPIGRMFGIGDGTRNDVVAFNPMQGIIMCGTCFPCNHLYLSYVSIGTVDTMTYIPIQAQASIEAYAYWKYAANKRTSNRNECTDLERIYHNEVRKMRARFNDMTATDISRIINRSYGVTQKIGGMNGEIRTLPGTGGWLGDFGNCPIYITNNTNPNYILFNVVLNSANSTANSFTDQRLSQGIAMLLTTDAQNYNQAFFTQNGTTITSDILNFYEGQTITVTLNLVQNV